MFAHPATQVISHTYIKDMGIACKDIDVIHLLHSKVATSNTLLIIKTAFATCETNAIFSQAILL